MAPLRVVGYGRNGDPLHEGKLDLPELLETPAADELTRAIDFIARRKWREAVTYRNTAPHEYTVRAWEKGLDANREFDLFVTYVRRFGHAALFYEIRHLYWVIGDFKYWTMGWPVDETTVINRALTDAAEPGKRG